MPPCPTGLPAALPSLIPLFLDSLSLGDSVDSGLGPGIHYGSISSGRGGSPGSWGSRHMERADAVKGVRMGTNLDNITSGPTGCLEKTIALTRSTFVGKVMSLLFNMLSRLVITFLPRSKCLTSWLQSPSAVILEPKKIKSDTVSTVSPSISHEVMGPDAMIFVF